MNYWNMSKLLEYVDYHLQLIVKEILPYDFQRKIEAIETTSSNSYFVIADAKSLYTSIPALEGVKTVKVFLENFPTLHKK